MTAKNVMYTATSRRQPRGPIAELSNYHTNLHGSFDTREAQANRAHFWHVSRFCANDVVNERPIENHLDMSIG